jgi:hypothetical protein
VYYISFILLRCTPYGWTVHQTSYLHDAGDVMDGWWMATHDEIRNDVSDVLVDYPAGPSGNMPWALPA